MRRRPAPIATAIVTAMLLAVSGCTSGDESNAPPDSSPASSARGGNGGDGVLDRLVDGGLTIVVRHAATDQSRPDQPTVDLNDCTTQRNLSDQGRSDARAIGDAIRRLAIPVGEVWSSPYCRSRDTAELAFGRAEVVHGLEHLYPERDPQADRRLNRRIGQNAPRAGEPNLVIVSHGVYPSLLAPAVSIGEGEAAVYARAGNGFTLLDRIGPTDWTTLRSDRLRSDVDELTAGAARVPDSVVTLTSPAGTGSAFRVAVPGILVTSARLVADATEVTVTRRDGTRLPARVLGRRVDLDIAALRVDDDSRLPPLHSGSGLSEARTGDRVFAVGADAVVAGSIRELAQTAIHVDTTVDTGVPRTGEGGPLVDHDGAVLGVLTTDITPGVDDHGTAIPVHLARDAVLEIVRTS